jgi:23S rRNA (uracil1939-C5)-methyltransferase
MNDAVHAGLAEVLEPSPDRVEPPCPLFRTCGGCHYQHAPYEYQLERKVEILREQLRRVGKIDYPGEIAVVSGPSLGYRNRVQVHLAEGDLGYLAPRSHELVPLEGDCPVASPRVNQVLALMRERLSDPRFPRFVHELEIFTNETNVQINALRSDRPLHRSFFEWFESAAWIDYPTTFGKFRVSARSFFQVNRFLVEKLVDVSLAGVEGKSALDLYAGVGLFAVPLAKRFASVVAVEAGPSAARDLEVNAAGMPVTVERGRVEDYLSKAQHAPDFVLADPPRTGLGKDVVRHLNRLSPERIVIVSCDPATLARDLAGLSGYKIDRIALVDLFPQTFHLETVVALSR